MKQFTNLKREIDAILLTLVMALVLSACGRTEANSAVTSEGADPINKLLRSGFVHGA